MFLKVTLELLKGFQTTVSLFGLTLVFALPLGLIICSGSRSRIIPIKFFCRFLVWVIRGTPLMLQLIAIFYGPGLIGSWAKGLGSSSPFINWFATWHVFDRFMAVVIAFVINYACYFSEIFRGGIESISKGQYEAGQVLGMTRSQIFFRIVLLQVIKRILAPMSNEFITLVKDTSLARIIAVYEIIWNAQQFIKLDGLLWPLFYTAAFYLIFNGMLTLIFNKLENKLAYYRS